MGFLTRDIWKTITEFTLKGKPNNVAVAYFGTGGAELLPLKEGDVLVVDASRHQVEAGLVDPSELLKLAKVGVKIYSYPQLHAKVFVLGDHLFIGSSNVSKNSSKNLQEAVLLTSESKMVKEAKEWIIELSNSPLLEDDLKKLKEHYKAPKKVTRSIVIENSLYLIEVNFNCNFSKGFEEPLKKGGEQVELLFPLISKKEYDYFEYPGPPEFEVGDFLLIRSENSKGEPMVNKPCRVLYIQSWESDGKHFVFYSKPIGKRHQIKKLGFKLRKKDGFLTIKKIEEIMGFWNLSFNEL
jgi:hypothetical protein